MRALLCCLAAILPAAAAAQSGSTVSPLRAPTEGWSGEGTEWKGKTAQQWAERLADDDVRTRWYAAYALGQLGPKAVAGVEPLTKTLANQSEHEFVRGGTAWALGRMGPAAESAVPLLTETLTSKHVSVRRNAAWALGNLGAAAKPAVPGLLKTLDDEDATVRVNAAAALWKIDRHAKAIPALAAALGRETESGPCQAATALGSLGSDAEPAVPALVDAFRHADADVRRGAARALGEIGPPAVHALRRALDDPNVEVRRNAVEAFRWMGEPALPELISALKNAMPPVRRSAARSIGRLGNAAKTAEAALVEAVNDPDAEVRDAAAKALGAIRKE